MKTRMMIAALLVWILITPAHAYMAQKEFRMSASGLDSLMITCDAGELHVKQNPGEEIHVLAEIEIRGLKEKEADVFARESIALWLRKNKEKGAFEKRDPPKTLAGAKSVGPLDRVGSGRAEFVY